MASDEGPPGSRSSSPVMASRLSRHASASSLRGFMRQSSRLSPSRENFSLSNRLLICQVDESRICRCSRLSDQPCSMKSADSQSSSSGWVGFSPSVPKLLGVRASGSPKCQPHTRLTMTRAVSGLFPATTERASSSRPLPSVNGGGSLPAMISRNRRGTISPGLRRSPRRATGMSAFPAS